MTGRFSGERAVVVGGGVAGAAAARALLAEGAAVTVTERQEAGRVPALTELAAAGAVVHAGGHDPSHLEGATIVVVSPGVSGDAPVLAWARERGIPVWGEMELGARLCDVPSVAVTGTNGKTTVTGMVAACLRAGGVDAVACGNIGHPFPAAALEDHDALVVECSSFQLTLQTSLHPRVSVLLNLAPDHLDRHGSFEGYAEAKAAVFANQEGDDVHVGNRGDPDARRVSARARCRVIWTTGGPPEAGEVGAGAGAVVSRIPCAEGVVPLPADARPALVADAVAATAAALAFGASIEAVAEGIAGFTPAAHRGQVAATVSGVRFIDDSKATNVHAALAAIRGVERAVLIAGGDAKGVDLAPLAREASRLTSVVAIGEAAPALAAAFEGTVPVTLAPSIEAAVEIAFVRAQGDGDTVLLAPACASWDQFAGYEERGDRFAAAARSMGEVSADGRS